MKKFGKFLLKCLMVAAIVIAAAYLLLFITSWVDFY